MFGFHDLSINVLTNSPVIVALALAALVGLAVHLYRRTNPPLPAYLRAILGGLRIGALLLVFLALLEPVVSYTREYVRRPRVAVLVDQSLSMNKTEDGRSRRARTDSLLASATLDNLRRVADLAPFFFGGSLGAARGSVDSTSTALGDALFELDKAQTAEPSDYWLLLSDGRSNAGRKPLDVAPSLRSPVISVDVSGGAESFDAGIDEVAFNPVLFVGRPTEIRVKLTWRNAEGRTLDVRLVDSARTAAESRLTVTQAAGRGEVMLRYTPEAPGQRLLQIALPPGENEESAANNQRTISVKVLKSRLSVLLAADRPDYEVGFLKRLLDGSDRYEVTLLATGARAGNLAGRFPTVQTELNRYNLVILYDPDPAAYTSRQEIIRSYLREKGGAVWLFMGPQFAARGPTSWLNDLLPFCQRIAQPLQYVEGRAEPLESHLFHPAIRLADNQAAIREAWASLPPFESLVWCDSIAPDGVVLAEFSRRTPAYAPPALGFRRLGPGKLFASAVLPFWPWGFVNLGFGEDDSNYRKFVDGVVGWLTVKDDFDPVRVQPEKDVFTRGEPVLFNGFAFDLGYRPIPGATGMVEVRGGPDDEEYQRDLVDEGEGRFRAVFENLAPGRYRYAAAIVKDGELLRADSGSFLIEAFSLEEFDQSGDPDLLAALGRTTGGRYYSYRQFDRILDDLDLAEIPVSTRREFTLWNKVWMLLAAIGALSLEWLLRKANQLV